jgi:uncharacterized protein
VVSGQGEWPGGQLDVAKLRTDGWTATPFRQFVVKLHGNCNLACRYCYVYEKADQSWSAKPRAASLGVVRQTARRIAEHARRHCLEEVEIVLHGGEPLLFGLGPTVEAIDILRAEISAATTIRMHTNGVLLSLRALDALLEHDVMIGVSLDGASGTHNEHRVFRTGHGSYDKVARGLRLLDREPYRRLFSGLLCTVDASSDPLETYETLAAFSPPRLDFLLPHANWSETPPRKTAGATPYADWLITIFDHWYGAARGGPSIRLFDEIIHLLLGGASTTEAVGLSPVALIVVDTDGAMEQVDSLKSAYHGAPETGLDVFSHSFDDALELPAIAARQIGVAALADTCKACPVHRICGGGQYPHRYRPGRGFRNPSVYCTDLRALITHVHRRLAVDIHLLAENSP